MRQNILLYENIDKIPYFKVKTLKSYFPKRDGNTYGDFKTAVNVTGWLNCQQQTSPVQEARKMVDDGEVRLSMIESEDNNADEIVFIKQYVHDVVDFSSQYGSDISISYTAYNITGKPSKFPDYGDFPQAFVMVRFLFSCTFSFMVNCTYLSVWYFI